MTEEIKITPARDGNEIAKSNEVLAINYLIDHYRDLLIHRQSVIKFRMEQLLNQTPPYGGEPRVSTRTSREQGGRDEIPLLFDNHQLKDLAEYIETAREAEQMIGELQRHKLRLMNDHDFTHGNPWQQWVLFGPPPGITGDFIFLMDDNDALLFLSEPAREQLLQKFGRLRRGRPPSRAHPLMISDTEVKQSGRAYHCNLAQREFLLDFARASGFSVSVNET